MTSMMYVTCMYIYDLYDVCDLYVYYMTSMMYVTCMYIYDLYDVCDLYVYI